MEVFVEAEASSRGVFLLVKNELDRDMTGDPDVYTPEYLSFSPDTSRMETYNDIYRKYLRLGDHLENLTL